MGIIIHTPYSSEGMAWRKGNLHTHTSCSDGDRSPQEVVDSYAARGYSFLMLSDHDRLTDPRSLDSRGMTLIPGAEISQGGPHLLHVGSAAAIEPAPDRQRVLDTIGMNGGMAIMCHPNWEEHFNHCPQELLENWRGYAGIEICNGICLIAPGSGYATDRWDRLLGHGRRVWGYANDDSHKVDHEELAWNVVQSDLTDVTSLVDALRAGRCYASTGVSIERIEVNDAVIRIGSQNAQRIIAYGDFQCRIGGVDGDAIEFHVSHEDPYTYVRFECLGAGGRAAWTQPFFIERR